MADLMIFMPSVWSTSSKLDVNFVSISRMRNGLWTFWGRASEALGHHRKGIGLWDGKTCRGERHARESCLLRYDTGTGQGRHDG